MLHFSVMNKSGGVVGTPTSMYIVLIPIFKKTYYIAYGCLYPSDWDKGKIKKRLLFSAVLPLKSCCALVVAPESLIFGVGEGLLNF